MSTYRADRIYKPPWFHIAPLQRGRPKSEPYIIGFDSEADNGAPFLLQFRLPDGTDDLIDVDTRDPLDGWRQFFRYIVEHCQSKRYEYLVFGFHLQYEYTQLFRGIPEEGRNRDTLNIEGRDRTGLYWHARGLADKRYTFTLAWHTGNCDTRHIAQPWQPCRRGSKRPVRVLDAMAYLAMSLDEASKIVDVGAKLAKPKSFSRKYRYDPAFIAYAKQDARITQRLGEWIIGLHDDYDVQTSISAPMFAARVFRRHYLDHELPIPAVDLEQAGLDAYHGGHNGFYVEKPASFRKIWSVDIRSAYPEAMRQLPNIEEAEWRYVTEYEPETHAIWHLTIRNNGCRYHPLMEDDGTRILGAGEYTGHWTGYEIDGALAEGDIEIVTVHGGWIMRGESGTGPFARFVDDFYAMKRKAETRAERETAKLFLNSTYGKTIQKNPNSPVIGAIDLETGEIVTTDPNLKYDYTAGGLYHPPIAALITGYVRAKIHRLEHALGALMTSTDGMFALRAPDPSIVGMGLGQLEATPGRVKLWRERLYVFRPTGGGKPKFALHGFRGKLKDLEHVPLRAGLLYKYTAQAMVTLRMSMHAVGRARHEPGEFVTLPFTLLLPGTALGP